VVIQRWRSWRIANRESSAVFNDAVGERL